MPRGSGVEPRERLDQEHASDADHGRDDDRPQRG
jgi:hypothetical protein